LTSYKAFLSVGAFQKHSQCKQSLDNGQDLKEEKDEETEKVVVQAGGEIY